jgi:hypothetical protein
MNESIVQKIEALILQTDDPKDRALLLIQLEMVKSLIENTEVTKDLHSEFKMHAKEEMAMIVKGRFLWRVLLAGALGLQGVLGFLFSQHLESHKALVSEVKVLNIDMATHKEHHRQEERFSAGPKVGR